MTTRDRASAAEREPLTIRPMLPGDWPAVQAIYAAGLAAGNATFETTTPTWEQFDSTRLAEHRLIADSRGVVLGWTAVSPVSTRAVYSGVVEHSVYVDPAAAGQGVGTALLAALIVSTEAAGIWMIQSSIFPENAASLALHRRAGFRVVGTRERIAQHHGSWRDTILVERRSAQ